MTDEDLERRLLELVARERRAMNDFLNCLNLLEAQHVYAKRGFVSMFDWLTRGLKYSKPAAHRRVHGARLLKLVPALADKLESGDHNLTNLTKVSTAIAKHERATQTKLSLDEKIVLLDAVEGKTTDEADIALFEHLPHTCDPNRRESITRINTEEVRAVLVLDNEAVMDLAWIKDHWSHAMPEARLSEICARLAREFRQRKSRSTAASGRLKNKRAACEYEDPKTGRICGSTHMVEIDHIIPRALGGSDAPENLRCLCRVHNLQAARDKLGVRWADSWRVSASGSS